MMTFETRGAGRLPLVLALAVGPVADLGALSQAQTASAACAADTPCSHRASPSPTRRSRRTSSS